MSEMTFKKYLVLMNGENNNQILNNRSLTCFKLADNNNQDIIIEKKIQMNVYFLTVKMFRLYTTIKFLAFDILFDIYSQTIKGVYYFV